MYGGTGNIYAGKKRWNAVEPSAVLTKTSLFLPARMQASLSSSLPGMSKNCPAGERDLGSGQVRMHETAQRDSRAYTCRAVCG